MAPTPSPSPIYIQMLGDTREWWDAPFFIALGGVIIGSLLTYLSSLFQDRRKAKREDAQRWDDRVLKHGVDAITAAAILPTELRAASEALVNEMKAAIAAVQASPGTDVVLSYRTASSPSHGKVVEECSTLELIAPRTVEEAAVTLRVTANRVVSTVLADAGVPFKNDDQVRAKPSDLEAAATALKNAIRKHFQL